jgi:hypothetical protein
VHVACAAGHYASRRTSRPRVEAKPRVGGRATQGPRRGGAPRPCRGRATQGPRAQGCHGHVGPPWPRARGSTALGQGQGVAMSRLWAREPGQGAARLAASHATPRAPRARTWSRAAASTSGASGHTGAVPHARLRQGGRTEPGAGTPHACRAGAGEEGDEEERDGGAHRGGGGDGRRGRTSSRGRGGSERRGRGGGERGELRGGRERENKRRCRGDEQGHGVGGL